MVIVEQAESVAAALALTAWLGSRFSYPRHAAARTN
jgi:hypothetical protein